MANVGKFIVFEGGEGAGKTTQRSRLADRMHAAGVAVTLTREPGGTAAGQRIRALLLTAETAVAQIPAKAEALLFAADRAAHVEKVIRPALARGEVVLCDRYIDSSIAYQGVGLGLDTATVAGLSEWATDGLLPDLVVLLDIDPQVGLARVAARGVSNRMDRRDVEFHARVREAFLDRADDPARYLVVDAAADPLTVADQIADRVEDLIGQCLPVTYAERS